MEKYKLSELIVIKNGRDHKDLPNGDYPVFGSGGIMRYVNSYLYDKPSVLLPRKGSLSNIQYSDTPFWTVDTLYYTEINEELVSPYYLYRYLRLLNMSRLDSGTGVPSMTFDSYYNINVFLPNIEEQRRVASILQKIDAKIALNRQINDNLEAMAKQLYDYWFVQFDFPDENGKPYKSSSGKMVWNEKLKRNIPELWTDTTLGCICDLYQPQTLGLSLLSDDEPFKVYGANGIVGHYNKYNHEQSEIAMACRGNSCGVLNRTMPKSWITGNAMVIHLKDETINNEFIKQALKYANVKGAISGSGQPQLTRENLEVLNIIKPSQRILLLYSNVVAPLVEKEINMEKEIDRLTKQRNTLLPLLMNGQVTINYHLSFGILFVYLFLYSQNMEYVWQQKIY